MDLPETAALVLAIFLQLVSASVNYIGMTIQKKAATTIPKIGRETGIFKSFKNMILNKAWVGGLALNSSSTLFAAGSFALASITIIQPLYGFGLIVLVIFIHFYLKERITRLDIIGVLFGISGIVVLGVTAKALDPISYTVLLDDFLGLRGIIFFAIVLVLALISYIISDRTSKTTSLVFLVISSAIWTSTQNIFNKAVATAIRDIGFVGAFFGEGWLYSWTFVLLFLFVSTIGIIMLNIAYQNGHAVIILPIWTAIQVVVPVLSGIIVFKEWHTGGYSATDIGIQSLGIFVMLASIVILSISSGKKEDFSKLMSTSQPTIEDEKQAENANQFENSESK
jgi:drug/metabolite transporter (DMT)-like permease